MSLRRFKIPLASLACTVVLTGIWLENQSGERGFRSHSMPGPFPSEWFMQQRIWPDAQLDLEDYLSACRAVAEIEKRSLDDPPPWIPAGPTNLDGRVTDIVGHPTNTQIFYIAAASGGVFKTIDGGQSWEAVFDDAASLSIGALALDPLNPEILYVGTGEANSSGYSYFGTGVHRSSNGGLSWTHLGLTETRYISRLAVDPENTGRIWAAAMGDLFVPNPERGVFRSEDGGSTWERVLFVNDTTGASDLILHPDNPLIVYAAMWQRIRTPQERRAGGIGSGIYKSMNGGESWVRLEGGLPLPSPDVGRIGLAISRSNPNVLYAIYADHPGYFAGIYRTDDGGESWGRVDDEPLEDLYSSFGWYFGNIRVRPDNPDVIFALGVDLARSVNGGGTWTTAPGYVHVDHHALWFDPLQPTRMLLGTDGGVYSSANNGNSWTYLGGLPIAQFYAATMDYQHPLRRYGGTQDNGTLRTLTGGLDDWSRILGGDGFYCLVDPTNSDVIYAESQWGNLARSTDGGSGWQMILNGIDLNDRTNWSAPVAMSPLSPQILYFGTHRVYRTVNRGNSWEPISPDLTNGGGSGSLPFGTITTIGISELNSSLIYAGTDDGNVWCTVNGGINWSNRSDGLPERWITRVAPDPILESVVYVTISGFRNSENDAHIFRSGNRGQTWTDISSNLPPGPLNDVVVDPEVEQRLYVASDFGTYVTINTGTDWLPLGESLPRVPVIDLVLHNPTRTLLAATYGRSMFTLDLNLLELNRPPEILSYEPALLDTVTAGQSIMFSVNAEDPDGDSLRYLWTRNGSAIGMDSSVEAVFDESNRTETIRIELSDGELSIDHEWQFYVAQPDAAPFVGSVPDRHVLVSAYPNPFNSAVTIRYSVPRAGRITVRVYDLSGRRLETLMEGHVPAGNGRVRWRAKDYPSGTYFLRVMADGEMITQKLLLIK